MVAGFRTGGFGNRPTPPKSPIDAQTQKQLEALRQPNTGQDVQSILNAQAQAAYQEPLPALDLEWTWSKPATETTPAQRGFRYTWNTARAGLNMRRDLIEKAFARLVEQSLVTHVADEAILPWKTITQAGVNPAPVQIDNNAPVLWTLFRGRVVFSARNIGNARVWYEKDDGTFAEMPTVNREPNDSVVNITSVTVAGVNYLVIVTTKYTVFYTAPTGGSAHIWQSLDVGIIPYGIVQTPAPGGAMVIASGATMLLVPADFSNFPLTPDQFTKYVVGYNTSDGIQTQISPRPVKLGGGQPRCWFLVEGGAGYFTRYIQSYDIYGVNRERLETSMWDIMGADIGRRGLVFHNLDRVVFYDNKERDLQIFFNSIPPAGYSYIVNGVKWVDDQVFCEVCQVPNIMAQDNGGTGHNAEANYTTYHSLWRFDFAIGKWAQTTEWASWQGYTGNPEQRISNLIFGAMSLTPAVQMMFSQFTRMFSFPFMDYFPNPFQDMHRFYQQPASVNPSAQLGTGRDVASSGRIRSPGLLFPQDTRYANKYIDEVWWGGEASGGAGSKLDFYWGEYGHLDDTDSNGRRQAMHAEFLDGLKHEQRHWMFHLNQSSVMIPQLEMDITRGTSDLSIQGFPLTILGHVDLPDTLNPEPNQAVGRSQV